MSASALAVSTFGVPSLISEDVHFPSTTTTTFTIAPEDTFDVQKYRPAAFDTLTSVCAIKPQFAYTLF